MQEKLKKKKKVIVPRLDNMNRKDRDITGGQGHRQNKDKKGQNRDQEKLPLSVPVFIIGPSPTIIY